MHLWLLLWLSGFHAVISKPFDDTSDQPNRNLPGDTDIKLGGNTFYLDSSPTEPIAFEPGLNQDGSRIALSDDKTIPGLILDITGQGLQKLGDGAGSWDLPSLSPGIKPKPTRPPGSYCPPNTVALCCMGFNERSDPPKLRRRQTQEERKYHRHWAACVSQIRGKHAPHHHYCEAYVKCCETFNQQSKNPPSGNGFRCLPAEVVT